MVPREKKGFTEMEDQKIYRQARRRAAAKFRFLIHLTVYIVVNLLLAAINLMASPQYYWFVWPLMGWGIGIVFHGLAIFVFTSGSLKEKMIQKEMERMHKTGNNRGPSADSSN